MTALSPTVLTWLVVAATFGLVALIAPSQPQTNEKVTVGSLL